MVEVLATLPELDMPRLHGFAERFARRGEEANADWRSLNYLFDGWLKGLARRAGRRRGNRARRSRGERTARAIARGGQP